MNKTSNLKVVTINILFEMKEWQQRRELLVKGLAAENADLIALQEVKLPEDNSVWLAEKLSLPYIHLVPYEQSEIKHIPLYGAAILSRYPFSKKAILDLASQGRKAQYVQIEWQGKPLIFCNGHYYWHPGPSPGRVKQIELLLDWLGSLPQETPLIAVGDFNGTPDTPAIALMREQFTSAYAAYHGQEPEYTCPTPLAWHGWQRKWRSFKLNLLKNRTLKPWRGTLDYIFINQHLKVKDCHLILNQSSPYSRTLYPSDHFGMAALLTAKC
ncbi:MAG: endonuclease/exonuclease/phosphatase family protein [Spirulinaceae cyanobacterium]